MCVGGGFWGILRVGEAIWGRGDHESFFYFSLGGGGVFCRGPNRWRRGKGLFFLIQSRWVQASNI
jgi:hypothetical protein